jgi:hypothetical protein
VTPSVETNIVGAVAVFDVPTINCEPVQIKDEPYVMDCEAVDQVMPSSE